MTDDPKVEELKTNTAKEADSFAGAIESVLRQMPQMLESQKILAKLQREHYLTLIEEGFDKNQALEIVSKMKL